MAALRKRYGTAEQPAAQPSTPAAPTVLAPAVASAPDKPAVAASNDEPASIKHRLEALQAGEEMLRQRYEEQARLEIAAQFAKSPPRPQPQQRPAEIESLAGEIDFEQRHGGREALAADMPRVHQALR